MMMMDDDDEMSSWKPAEIVLISEALTVNVVKNRR